MVAHIALPTSCFTHVCLTFYIPSRNSHSRAITAFSCKTEDQASRSGYMYHSTWTKHQKMYWWSIQITFCKLLVKWEILMLSFFVCDLCKSPLVGGDDFKMARPALWMSCTLAALTPAAELGIYSEGNYKFFSRSRIICWMCPESLHYFLQLNGY